MITKSDKSQDKPRQLRTSGTLNRKPERVTDPLFSEQAFFDPRDLVQIKYEMLRRVLHDGHSITEAAAAFGFSRPAFYKAKRALQACGLAGLVPARTGPRGAHKLNDEVMAFVLAAKAHDSGLTSRDLVERIAGQFGLTVHSRSVERALVRKKKPGSERSRQPGVDNA
ncbi:MAG: helix-turn-helix domain containing protein [Gammaproteobacteria bacterium]|nr:helix-turn-helix domain containing protein [Gammaproteobacteria bacterium]